MSTLEATSAGYSIFSSAPSRVDLCVSGPRWMCEQCLSGDELVTYLKRPFAPFPFHTLGSHTAATSPGTWCVLRSSIGVLHLGCISLRRTFYWKQVLMFG